MIEIRKNPLSDSQIIPLDDLNMQFVFGYFSKIENRRKFLFISDNKKEEILGYMDFKYLCEKYDKSSTSFSKDIYCASDQITETEIKSTLYESPHTLIIEREKNGHMYFYQGININRIEPYELALAFLPAMRDEFIDKYANMSCEGETYLELTQQQIDKIFGIFGNIGSRILSTDYYVTGENDNANIITVSCPKSLAFDFYKDSNTMSIENVLVELILPKLIRFFNDRDVQLWFIEGPVDKKLIYKKEDQPFLNQGLSLNEVLQNKDFIRLCFSRSKGVYDYITTGAFHRNRVTSDGICIKSAYYSSKLLNINAIGERRTLQCKTTPQNNIFIFGSCLSFGLFEDDMHTPASLFQEKLNHKNLPYSVRNLGVKGLNCELNDILMVMNTKTNTGDKIVIINEFSNTIQKILSENGLSIYQLTTYINQHPLPQFSLLNNSYHGNNHLYETDMNGFRQRE